MIGQGSFIGVVTRDAEKEPGCRVVGRQVPGRQRRRGDIQSRKPRVAATSGYILG